MADFTWIASYPKSGNTWLRFIIGHMVFEAGEDVSSIPAMVPDMHDWTGPIRYPWKGQYFAKTHFVFSRLPKTMHTRAAIYVTRHPLDGVVSSVEDMQPSDQEGRDDLINQYVEHGTFTHWLGLDYGSWEENVSSWAFRDHDFPYLQLRYEDIKADPHKEIRKIADFLELEVSDGRIAEVVEATSFESMRKAEEKELEAGADDGVFGHEMSYKSGNFRFMRSGKSGGYRDSLTAAQIEALVGRFKETMDRLGYTV